MRWIMKFTGYALLAAVFALCLKTVPPQIESDLLSATQKTLQSNKLGWAMVSIDGRDVLLSGLPPDSAAAKKAVALTHETPGVRNVETDWVEGNVSTLPKQQNTPRSINIAAMEATRKTLSPQQHDIHSLVSITLPTQPGINYESED